MLSISRNILKRRAINLTLNPRWYQNKAPTIIPPVFHSNISNSRQWSTSRAMHISNQWHTACCHLSLGTKKAMPARDYRSHALEEYSSKSSQLDKLVPRVQLATSYCNRSVSWRAVYTTCISRGNYSSLWAFGNYSWNISVGIIFHLSNKSVTGKFFWKAIELGYVT